MMTPMNSLAASDPEIAQLISREERRQVESIRLIASENYVSDSVLAASGTALTNNNGRVGFSPPGS